MTEADLRLIPLPGQNFGLTGWRVSLSSPVAVLRAPDWPRGFGLQRRVESHCYPVLKLRTPLCAYQ